MIFFNLGVEPPKNSLLEYIKPTPVIEETIELSIEEKIATNYYQCDELTEWIRADNAQCLPKSNSHRGSQSVRDSKTVQTSTQSQKHAQTASPQAGWYPVGECTWLVWTKRPVGYWNDATEWLWQAKRDGYQTGTIPKAGAIAWRYGHVAFTEQVNGNMILVTEANYNKKKSVRTIWVHKSEYSHYIY